MPEIPNVVPGEPVESDWGNDIRDRSVQKYADLTALEDSQPVPQLGEVAWLDDPGQLVVCTDTTPVTWTPITFDLDQFVLKAGDTMTGDLSMGDNFLVLDAPGSPNGLWRIFQGPGDGQLQFQNLDGSGFTVLDLRRTYALFNRPIRGPRERVGSFNSSTGTISGSETTVATVTVPRSGIWRYTLEAEVSNSVPLGQSAEVGGVTIRSRIDGSGGLSWSCRQWTEASRAWRQQFFATGVGTRSSGEVITMTASRVGVRSTPSLRNVRLGIEQVDSTP